MNYHLKEIVLTGKPEERSEWERYTFKPPQEGARRLSNLSKINIFVGENNSGKSKFLRHLAAIEKIQFSPHLNGIQDWKWSEIALAAQNLRQNVESCFDGQGIRDADGIRNQLTHIPTLLYLSEGPTAMAQLISFAKRLSGLPSLGNVVSSGNYDERTILITLKQSAEAFLSNVAHMTGAEKLGDYAFTKIYIPTLRGLRNFSTERDEKGQAKDIYYERTIKDYFSGTAPQIFTGLKLYYDVQRLLLGNLADRNKIREFEKFLTESFFEGKPVALIPKLDSTLLTVKIGEEGERSISELGDGIQSVIILTFPLFMNRDKRLLVFCEEPELYMHPSMQRVLLKTYSEKFPENQYFLTTHSNHFLDLTLDLPSVSVYTFRKELDDGAEERLAKFEVENVSNEDSRSLLLLGVRNSSVFLSNCTIWVEGITDRRYFRKYLNLFQDSLAKSDKRFKEDLHYSFVEYGGSNVTHFSFLDTTPDPIVVERLCGKLFLITDRDNATGAKAERHKELREELKERYYCLACKEVENLLTPHIVKSVVSQFEEPGATFAEFVQEDYANASLGEFIETKVLKAKRTRAASYAKDSSLRDKPDFCLKAIEQMKSFADLSKEAQEIANRLYNFIAENNK
jgi:predicted ATP-dependent endonuclease of OLD family